MTLLQRLLLIANGGCWFPRFVPVGCLPLHFCLVLLHLLMINWIQLQTACNYHFFFYFQPHLFRCVSCGRKCWNTRFVEKYIYKWMGVGHPRSDFILSCWTCLMLVQFVVCLCILFRSFEAKLDFQWPLESSLISVCWLKVHFALSCMQCFLLCVQFCGEGLFTKTESTVLKLHHPAQLHSMLLCDLTPFKVCSLVLA